MKNKIKLNVFFLNSISQYQLCYNYSNCHWVLEVWLNPDETYRNDLEGEVTVSPPTTVRDDSNTEGDRRK